MWERYGTLTPMVAGIVLAALALSTPAAATNLIYLRCESATGTVTAGDLDASSIGEDLAGQSHPMSVVDDYALVLSYTEGAQSTPLPGGGADYDYAGLTIVRPEASSSPNFLKALFTGEVWTYCVLEFYRRDSSEFKKYREITMETVNVVQIEPRAVTQFEGAGTGKNHLEAITFSFRKIKWSSDQGPEFYFDLESGEQQ